MKHIIARLLCNSTTGLLIAWIFRNKIPCIRYKEPLRFDCSSPHIKNMYKSAIFFGIYEGAEIRFIKKWITDQYDVVELGASLGITSNYIATRIGNKKLTVVEALPPFIPIIESNLRLNNIQNTSVLTNAIGSTEQPLYFIRTDDNTTGKIVEVKEPNAESIFTVSLSSILHSEKINDYVLVCDIEGAEIYIIMEDVKALDHCKCLIIELHDTTYHKEHYTIKQLKTKFLDLGFEISDNYGSIYVFKKDQC